VLSGLLRVALGVLLGIALTVLAGPRVRELSARIQSKLARELGELRGAEADGSGWQPATGYALEVHARELDYPVRIVFRPGARPDAAGPLYYVAELPGRIRWIDAAGASHVLTEGLLNFEWPELTELGLMGLAIAPDASGLYLTLTYWDAAAGVYRNRIDRLELGPDGTTAGERRTLLDLAGEATVASYCIQFVSVGPDGKLYVGVGKGGDPTSSQDEDLFAGKILRLLPDGSAAPDNPFFDPAAPTAARSYVYALGFRNPFDLTWDPVSGSAFVSDVGPGIDRVLRLERGRNYCFGDASGEDAMRCNALYTWGPGGGYAPTGITTWSDSLVVGLFGAVHMPGPNRGKHVERFALDDVGALESGSTPVVSYTGAYFSSVTDIDVLDGNLYFLDLYGTGNLSHRGKGVVYRLKPSAAAALPNGVPGARSGAELFAGLGCAACHTRAQSDAPLEGPALDPGFGARLVERLDGAAYAQLLDELAARPGQYFAERRELYAQLRASSGRARARLWFSEHLRDPRFDNPEGKMPAFAALDEAELETLTDFVLGP